MSYNEVKRSYDVAKREQIAADRELNRITKEISGLQESYKRIDESFESQVISDKARALEEYRKSNVEPIEKQLSEVISCRADMEEEYKEKQCNITFDNIMSECSSKKEILEEIEESSSVLQTRLKEIVGQRFYNDLSNTLEVTSFNIDNPEDAKKLIRYFNKSEKKIKNMSSDKGMVENVLTMFESFLLGKNQNALLIVAVVLFAVLLFFTRAFLWTYVLLCLVYVVFNIIRNFHVYEMLITQLTVKNNIDYVNELLEQQVKEEMESRNSALDAKYLPKIEELQKQEDNLQQRVIDASAEADNSFIYDATRLDSQKSAERAKLDNRKSQLLTRQAQQQAILDEKTKNVMHLEEQLNKLLSGLQEHYLGGIGTATIFDPVFLFDIDTMKNKPILFKHPMASVLFIYNDLSDVYAFIRLLCIQLRAKLNPYSLSVTVTDMLNMGQELLFFANPSGFEESEINAIFKIVHGAEDLRETMEGYDTTLKQRQKSISIEFKTIEAYNEAMLKLESLTEPYDFLFMIEPDSSVTQDTNFGQLLRVGGSLGIFTHLFISRDSFIKVKDASRDLLDKVESVYFLDSNSVLPRAKEFICETLLSE